MSNILIVINFGVELRNIVGVGMEEVCVVLY